MAGNIIPAIATTNAMTASLCVLQSFKVLRGDYDKARMLFLSKSTDRLISSEGLRPPNPDCPVCGVCQARLAVDLSRATLSNLVEDILKQHLAYGAEFSISTEAGMIFDPEEDENLPKKLSDLGVKQDGFITVVDEDDENPRVNLVFNVVEQEQQQADTLPIALLDKFEIAHKVKPPLPMLNDNKQNNGTGDSRIVSKGVGSGKRKREADDADVEADLTRKRGKVMEGQPSKANQDDNVVVVDDGGIGAIVIDD